MLAFPFVNFHAPDSRHLIHEQASSPKMLPLPRRIRIYHPRFHPLCIFCGGYFRLCDHVWQSHTVSKDVPRLSDEAFARAYDTRGSKLIGDQLLLSLTFLNLVLPDSMDGFLHLTASVSTNSTPNVLDEL